MWTRRGGRPSAARFVAGLLSVILLLGVSATAAFATQPPDTCDDNVFKQVLAHQHANEGNHKGIRGMVQFYTSTDACARVSSIFGYISDSRFVEYGWNLGYDCFQHYHTNPVRFIAWETALQGFHCITIAESVGQHQLKLQDQNEDTVWTPSLDGTAESGYKMDVNFSQAIMITNAERHNNNDSNTAHFWALEAFTVGSCCYANFDDLRLFCDTDGAWKFDKVTNTEHFVSSSSTSNSCPG
jgi:hypothetical protein